MMDVLLIEYFDLQKTEEMEIARETIRSLRECFRPSDPQQHTLDALEQVSIVQLPYLITCNEITINEWMGGRLKG